MMADPHFAEDAIVHRRRNLGWSPERLTGTERETYGKMKARLTWEIPRCPDWGKTVALNRELWSGVGLELEHDADFLYLFLRASKESGHENSWFLRMPRREQTRLFQRDLLAAGAEEDMPVEWFSRRYDVSSPFVILSAKEVTEKSYPLFVVPGIVFRDQTFCSEADAQGFETYTEWHPPGFLT